ncbi:hypothetical protein C7212DRAFT_359656 [Tuber magnatum]|uniref:DNA polymerase n=1 Tax=Tuber magnatum TaxID=42249 RepID=A0A317SKW0_9PEZI|nr:hypothetical protein C7212DRAFT_359656 [Tuber magnatum]
MAFRIRLNNIDSYQAYPTLLDPTFPHIPDDERPPKIPIVRVFGATETGQKVCAHIHGAFPYLYVEYPGKILMPEDDRAMGLSAGRSIGSQERPPRFVAHISLVKGVPFYGFHVGWKFYCKIYLFNPHMRGRLAKILQSGGVLSRVFQPHEAHIQYIPQFMIDFNLNGCGFIECDKVLFRGEIPDADEVGEQHLWHSKSIPEISILPESQFQRQSYCTLEVDIHVRDIFNRKQVSARPLHYDFVERTNPISPDIKLVHSMAELWKDENRRRGNGGRPAEGLVSSSSDQREPPGAWIHEEEYRERIKDIIKTERQASDGRTIRFETYVSRTQFENLWPTAFESVAESFEGGGLPPDKKVELEVEAETAEVDESLLYDIGEGEFSDSDFEGLFDVIVDPEAERRAKVKAEKSYGQPKGGLVGEQQGHGLQILSSPPVPEASNGEGRVEKSLSNNNSRLTVTDGLSYKRLVEEFIEEEDDIVVTDSRVWFPTGTVDPDVPTSYQVPSKRVKMEFASPNVESQIPPASDRSDAFEKICSTPDSVGRSISHAKPSTLSSDRASSAQPGGRFTDSGSENSGTRASESEPSQTGRKRAHAPSNSYPGTSHCAKLPPATRLDPVSSLYNAFDIPLSSSIRCYSQRAPSLSEVLTPEDKEEIASVTYQEPYYSDDKDVPTKPWEYAGREFKFKSSKLSDLPIFNPINENRITWEHNRLNQRDPKFKVWNIAEVPPSRKEAAELLEEGRSAKEGKGVRQNIAYERNNFLASQIQGPTQKNKYGFKFSQNAKSDSVQHELQHMSVMSLELHINTVGDFVPNAERDRIECIFWSLKEMEEGDDGEVKEVTRIGIITLVDERSDGLDPGLKFRRQCRADVRTESSELDMINTLIDTVRVLDPDILTGWEVNSSSWGYLVKRAKHLFDMNLCDNLSRVKTETHSRFGKESNLWGFNTGSAIKITGRHMVNIWRAMTAELNLLGYSMENVVFHLLHQRIPHYSFKVLTGWYTSGSLLLLGKVIKHLVRKVQLDLEILDRQELITRTSEQARLLGIDFASVSGRGSQFKVESMMFRIAKPESFILVSPSKAQVGQQNALECLPLVMEPFSRFYTSPVVVLDFQSLYPSVMIAHNYCYSTFLGRMTPWLAPNGMMYIKQTIRKSLLAKMLTEILDTRVMVKNGMKRDKHDKALQKLLNSRQLALKLIANVTYGYASASHSGRMPCAEIADSIVQTGREILEKAIRLIQEDPNWDAEVVYGDTDSLFIHLEGRTKDEAFRIGEEIAARVTEANPRPIKLKFEKVYLPCVLLAKKRYVGFKYEYREQAEPDFDAKGIETVRRDGTPAEQMIEEAALKILFRTKDLSQVKAYCQREWTKIMREKAVRLGTYAEGASLPPGAQLAAKRMEKDPENAPQYAERIPYVVIAGSPGQTLADRTIEVNDLLASPELRLDSEYYICKNIIPPLERIFNLVGANVRQWYDEMPKYRHLRKLVKSNDPTAAASGFSPQKEKSRAIIESYMTKSSNTCAVCSCKAARTKNNLCKDCTQNRDASIIHVRTKLARAEKRVLDLQAVCRSCEGSSPGEEVACASQDCAVYYSRRRQGAAFTWERENVKGVLGALEGVGELEW